MEDFLLRKILRVARKNFEQAGGRFTFLDPNGMRWHGSCRCVVIDYLPDRYVMVGIVTSGPVEWVDLSIIVYGKDEEEDLSVEPEVTYRAHRNVSQELPTAYELANFCVDAFEPESLSLRS